MRCLVLMTGFLLLGLSIVANAQRYEVSCRIPP
jgi:hypothetical protein